MTEKSKTAIISENLLRGFVQLRRLRSVESTFTLNPNNLKLELKNSELLLLLELKEVELEHPEGITVTELSKSLQVKPPSITPIITSLEEKGMLDRTMDTKDRRIVRVRLKEQGRLYIRESKTRMVAQIQGLVEYLGEEKSITLTELINESFQYITDRSK